MSNIGVGLRPTGVQATSQEDRRAPARTLQHCVPAKMYAIETGDEQGVRRTTLVLQVGDAWYHDPNGENWVKTLRPIVKDSWLAKQLVQAVAATEAAKNGSVPKQDSVDILR